MSESAVFYTTQIDVLLTLDSNKVSCRGNKKIDKPELLWQSISCFGKNAFGGGG